MGRGPLGNDRLTTIGPFTYDPTMPPEPSSGFTPPDDIMNPRGDIRWWTNWENASKEGGVGATIFYDPEADRVIIENRLDGPEGTVYTHDDMVVDMIERSPLPRFPSTVVPAEGGTVEINGRFKGSFEMPNEAGGAFVSTERLSEDKEIIQDGSKVDPDWFYKVVYALKMIDFPEDVPVNLKHKLGPRLGSVFESKREFQMQEAYLQLQFDGMLPEPKV